MLNTSSVIAIANTPSLKAIVRSKPLRLSPLAEATAMAGRFAVAHANPLRPRAVGLGSGRELSPIGRGRARARRGGDDRRGGRRRGARVRRGGRGGQRI